MHLTRNQAYSQGYRGFESLPLRQTLCSLRANNLTSQTEALLVRGLLEGQYPPEPCFVPFFCPPPLPPPLPPPELPPFFPPPPDFPLEPPPPPPPPELSCSCGSPIW